MRKDRPTSLLHNSHGGDSVYLSIKLPRQDLSHSVDLGKSRESCLLFLVHGLQSPQTAAGYYLVDLLGQTLPHEWYSQCILQQRQ